MLASTCSTRLIDNDYHLLLSFTTLTLLSLSLFSLSSSSISLPLSSLPSSIRIGYDTLVYIEGLHLSGNVQAIILFDYEAPFPHIGWISATFTRKLVYLYIHIILYWSIEPKETYSLVKSSLCQPF